MTDSLIYRTMPDQIADRLRRDIVSGRLKPDQPLREQELSERFGVSRGPIREVFRLLTQQGLLVREPNKGVRVAQQPSSSVRPLVVELRRTIETFALNNIFEEITTEDITMWEGILADIKEACFQGDTNALVDHDLRFHRSIIQSYDEKELFAIWQPIAMRMLMSYNRFGDLIESYYEHEKIIDAIRGGDQAAAVDALNANIQ